jgi:hypothetical protein
VTVRVVVEVRRGPSWPRRVVEAIVTTVSVLTFLAALAYAGLYLLGLTR